MNRKNRPHLPGVVLIVCRLFLSFPVDNRIGCSCANKANRLARVFGTFVLPYLSLYIGNKHDRAENRGRTYRLLAVIAFGLLFVAVTLAAGCDSGAHKTKAIPPTPHRLTDITIRSSTDGIIPTPTAAVSSEIDVSDDDRAVDTASRPPETKKEPENPAEEVTGGRVVTPKRGEYTIQIGAYIIDENLSRVKEGVLSVGFTPYTVEIGRKIKMFCVMVAEGKTRAEASEIVSALSAKGFKPRLLPNEVNTVDVAGGIYYYKYDALAAGGRIAALGYDTNIQERVVDVVLTCLRVGRYGSADEAAKDMNTLKEKGFSPVILKNDQ